MKIRLPASVLAAMILCACTRGPVTPRFETLAVDTLLEGQLMDCKVEYRFAAIGNASESAALAAIDAANIGYFFEVEEFGGTPQEAAAVAIDRIADELKLPAGGEESSLKRSGWGPGEVSVASEAAVADSLVNYTIWRWNFLGGAHGMYTIELHVYTLTEGYELTLADLFTEEQLPRVDTLIRRKLYEQYEARSDEELTEQGFFPEYIAATENFLLTPQEMTFHYNPYEIGCYALGPVEVTLTREELDEIRKP